MTLGERLYRAAVATGAHPFAFPYGEGAKLWTDLDEAQQARWEACGAMYMADSLRPEHVDASMARADERRQIAEHLRVCASHWSGEREMAFLDAAYQAEEGRS